MLAVLNQSILNHRASAYNELHTARARLMGLRQTRSGLFIKKRNNPFSSHNILRLLADIAAAKFEEFRILLSLDVFEKQLRTEKLAAKQRRIWLGYAKTQMMEEAKPQFTQHTHRQKRGNVTAFLITALWLRGLQRPTP